MTFRQDINGLRAWAVIAVILFHFDIKGFQGGFVGVDVFFVISGFLMTDIIFRRMQENRFSLIGFYLDRFKRIVPALAFLCLVMLLLGWHKLPSAEYEKLGKHIWGSTGFFSNYLYLGESGYFEKSAVGGKWLQHTWSLSVEWQFYLLYPLLLILLSKTIGQQKTKYALVLLTLLSLAWCIIESQRRIDNAFFLLPSRLWELVAGGLICLYPLALSRRNKNIIECGGFILITGSFILITENGWPGWHALLPVTGTALILLSAQEKSLLTSNLPAQWIGNISYSAYLWHWPIAYYLYKSALLSIPAFLLPGIGASFVLATISWLVIEKPVKKRFYILLMIFLSTLLISYSGYRVWKHNGFPDRSWETRERQVNEFFQKYEVMHKSLGPFYHFECGFFDENTFVRKESIDASCTQNLKGNIIFLWGDSHAQALSYGLRELASGNFSVAQVATSQCKPSLAGQWETPGVDNNCDHANAFALQEIARLQPAYVVMAQEHYHENTNWNEIANRLHALGVKHVILVGPVPQWQPSLPAIMVERHWNSGESAIHDAGLMGKVIDTDRLLHQQYDSSTLLRYVSMMDALCKNETCQVKVPGNDELLALDYGHLTPTGSIYAVKAAMGNVFVD